MQKTIYVIFIILLSFTTLSAKELAIIVNKNNPAENISFKELVKIYKYKKRFWKDGKKIYLIILETGTPEKTIFLEKIYKLKEIGLKKFWLSKMFRGDISSFPKTLSSNIAVISFVSQAENAIGFIDSKSAGTSVKILKINGKLPGDNGYLLSD